MEKIDDLYITRKILHESTTKVLEQIGELVGKIRFVRNVIAF